MQFEATPISGCYIVRLEPRKDQRGFFARTFCAHEFEKHGLDTNMVQSNWSASIAKHTLRGMHYQTNGSEEAKLVRCLRGRILDVCLDLRRDSTTFGRHVIVELTEMNDSMLYLPRGTAHGFLTLDENCQVFYQVSNFYDPINERGVRWNDPFFAVAWPVLHPILSEKDQSYPDFQ